MRWRIQNPIRIPLLQITLNWIGNPAAQMSMAHTQLPPRPNLGTASRAPPAFTIARTLSLLWTGTQKVKHGMGSPHHLVVKYSSDKTADAEEHCQSPPMRKTLCLTFFQPKQKAPHQHGASNPARGPQCKSLAHWCQQHASRAQSTSQTMFKIIEVVWQYLRTAIRCFHHACMHAVQHLLR